MKFTRIPPSLLLALLSMQQTAFTRSLAPLRNAATRTCPCNMVPVITEETDVKKVIQKFKEARPRSQRAQLVGFIKQYVANPTAITQMVMVQASKAYSERMKSNNVYHLVQDVVKATNKRPAQAKAMLALGKVLRMVYE